MSVADHMQFDNICRTCLSEEENMKSIFDTDCSLGETLQLFQMLIACTSVQVQDDDGLPAQICLTCIEKVRQSSSFKKLCEDSDATLREMVRKATITDCESWIEMKPFSHVALCAQETIADTDTDMLDIKMKFEEGETKIGDRLILDTEYTDYVEDIKMMKNADDVTPPAIKPNENTKSDAIKSDLTVRSALKNHANTRRTSQLKCEECGKPSGNSAALTKHMKTMHGIAPRSHVCHYCGRGFNSLSHLMRHLPTHTGEKKFACKVCDKRFADPSALSRHGQVHAKQQKDLICSDCGRGFSASHRTAFIAHQKMHLRDNNCVCNICGKQLSSKSKLDIHMKVHTGQKEHVCPKCGKAFSTVAYLRVHERYHNGEKRFMCEVCGSGCVTSSELKLHMPIHTSEKSFKCHLCSRTFRRRGNLLEHIKTHMIHRKRTHICEYCQKGFYQAADLRKHLRIHTGEKPHTCRICNKSFARAYVLTRHMKNH